MTRKTFVNIFFRTSILAGMAALVGVFFLKDQISQSGGCPTTPTCKTCNKFSNCTLDEANIFKNNGRR